MEVVLLVGVAAMIAPSVIAIGVKLIRYAEDAIRAALLS